MTTGDDENGAVEALWNQAAYDELLAQGRMTSVPMAVASQRTGWDGLTPKQEEEARLLHRREQAFAEAEYEQTMEEVRERADRLMTQLDEQRRECLQKLADADARAIILPDGRHVLVGDNGEYIEEATGRTLNGDDKTEAQRRRKPDSETAAEQKAWKDRLIEIDNAQKHVQKARDLASQDGKNLSPEEKKQKEAEARHELDTAEAMAKGVEAKNRHIEADAAAASTLSETGTLAALGLGASHSGRTTSFAANMEEKDSRSIALQDRFTASARGADAGNLASLGSSGTAAIKKPEFQQNNS